jgi:CPA2 family monovalent cation:H+ antiporter-2
MWMNMHELLTTLQFSLAATSDAAGLPILRTIAAGFTAAWLLGLLTQWCGLSPIVGYLLAGVLIGPYTPGIVGDKDSAHQLAEVGVILLMFGVGIHFHLKDLLAVKWIAIPGAVGQSVIATLVAMAVFYAFGFSLKAGAVLGMAMAVASTVVLMRVLIDADMLSSPQGHAAVGWLLVEDILTVIVLVLIPIMGNGGGETEQLAGGETQQVAGGLQAFAIALGIALFKLAMLVTIMVVVGSRVIPWVLVQVARLRSRELFTLTVLVFSIAMAAAAFRFFGASPALGAFLAGMLVAQSPVSHQVAADALPMRDAFAVIFFVSVGMVFDPAFIVQQPLMIVAALGIILLVKPLAALLIVGVLGHSVRTALTVALGLAQIGEFSFILSELAHQHGLFPKADNSGHNVLVAAAIISITLNPLLFRMLLPIENWLRRYPRLWLLLNGRAERNARSINLSTEEKLTVGKGTDERLAIVVGFGPVGRAVHRLLSDAGLTTVVIDLNVDTVSELTSRGQLAIFGDASHESILEQAGMERASHLVLTLPHSSARIAVVTAARNINTDARILVRAHYLREREDLERAGASAAVFEEAEVAVALARLVLANTGAQRDVMEQKIRDLRLQLILQNMTNIRSQRVRSVMVPWTRVRRLSASTPRREVLQHVAEQRFSRWPVTDRDSGRVIGYLLAKDLIAEASADGAWNHLVRPLRAVRSDDDIESVLLAMQNEGASVYVVEDSTAPVGFITLEDILEQVVGRIEDEYPHEPAISLSDAVAAGGIVLDLQGQSAEAVIAELAAAIAPSQVPADIDIAQIAIAREHELSTDLGIGVALPHARCPKLPKALVVVGRSSQGVEFSARSSEPVRLVFLLVTPAEQPDLQLSLLAQLAQLAGNEKARQSLLQASSAADVRNIITQTSRAAVAAART